jgi:uncharacterized protein YcbX
VTEADAEVTGLASGALRDREWMVIDRDGRFVTQREYPRLALIEPALAGNALRLTAPDSAALDVALDGSCGESREVVVWRTQVRGFDQGDAAAAWLSAFLHADDLRLVRFDPAARRRCNPDYVGDSGAHTFFSDGYPILVIGAASLDDLNARLVARGSPALPMNRFRPNVVIADLPPYDEDHLDTIACGAVTLKLVKPCTRCQVTTTDQATACTGAAGTRLHMVIDPGGGTVPRYRFRFTAGWLPKAETGVVGATNPLEAPVTVELMRSAVTTKATLEDCRQISRRLLLCR